MTTTAAVLTMVSESGLRDEVDRIVAAVGARVVHTTDAASLTRSAWASATAVIVDRNTAMTDLVAGRPRRSDVFLVVDGGAEGRQPEAEVLRDALAIGAQRVVTLPAEAADFAALLSTLGDGMLPSAGAGTVVAVIGGRGGAGASVFAAAVALADRDSLLVDLDAQAGGLDLLIGAEAAHGLRWPDLALQDGRIGWTAIRTALPEHRGIAVLSGGRRAHDISPAAVAAVLDAGRRGGATVVCDLARQLSDHVCAALDGADLVVVIAPSDLRSCAATAALAPRLADINPNVGLVVRGPAPGGLRSADVSAAVGLPLLAAMRPEPLLAEKLEGGGLQLGRRSPLAAAARQVRALLGHSPAAARGCAA